MKVTVLFFGALSSITEKRKMEITDIEETGPLLEYLRSQYPQLEKFKFRIAVNQQAITGARSLADGDEVALLPPFSGG